MKQHSEHRGVKIYTDAKGHFASKFGEHLTLLKCIEKIDHRLDYKPKNNWVFDGKTNECFTDEQFEELEEELIFSGETININKLYISAMSKFVFDFDFKGINIEGVMELTEDAQGFWESENSIDGTDIANWLMCKEILSEDMLNDIFENHKEYLEKGL